MKGSPCCAGLMRSCLHTYRTKTNLTQHIIQPWGGASVKYGEGHQPTMGGPSANYGGAISQVWWGSSTNYGGVINQLWGAISQVWGGHQPSMGRGVINQLKGGPSANYGGAISQVWGGHIFPPVCTGSQNPQNYFSNIYILPSVNRTAGPKTVNIHTQYKRCFSMNSFFDGKHTLQCTGIVNVECRLYNNGIILNSLNQIL